MKLLRWRGINKRKEENFLTRDKNMKITLRKLEADNIFVVIPEIFSICTKCREIEKRDNQKMRGIEKGNFYLYMKFLCTWK